MRVRGHPLHVVLLLLIAAGLALQPALATMGALHELSEQAGAPGTAAHADAPATPIAAADAASARGDAATPDPLHVLLHFAHCCAPSGALFVPPLAFAPAPPPASAPIGADARAVAHTYLHGPFRPPIAA